MHPILHRYSFFGQERLIAGYGLMVALAVVVGVTVATLLARRRRLDVVNTLLVALISVGAGLIGSYLLFLITMIPEAIRRPSALLTAGLVFYGGPLAAIPAAWIASKRLDLPPLKLADLAAPALTLGHALGRMGCFLGGCCFGDKWDGPLAVTFTHPLSPAAMPPMPRHPVQMYESGFLLLLSLGLMLGWSRTRGDGRIALYYVMLYGMWRFFIETMRSDGVRGFVIPALISTSQAISLALVPAAVAGLIWLSRRARAEVTG